MDWLTSLVPPPSSRSPLTLQTFTREFIPPILCYYATAVLVILPRTFAIRLALLPITLWAAFRASTQLDLAAGWGDHYESLVYLNQGLLLAMTTLVMRVCIWTSQQKPYRRLSSPLSKDASMTQVFVDACDLSFNLRGLGWNWSHGLNVPPETRPRTSPFTFNLSTALSCIGHIIAFDCFHYSAQSFDFNSIGSPAGGSIFDSSLSPLLRYLRSSTITLISGLTVYCGIQGVYLFLSLMGLLLLDQSPAQWPPGFWDPWWATSLSQFWSRRWHQIFRDNFVSFGGRPISLVTGTGRVGTVLGAFLASGILHDFGLWGMGRGTDFGRVGGFFLMQGVGILLEGVWKRGITGKRVQGRLGWIWTLLWLILWGHGLVEAWATRGLIGSYFMPPSWRPSRWIVGGLRGAIRGRVDGHGDLS